MLKFFSLFLFYAIIETHCMEYLNNGPYKIPALGLGTFTVMDKHELTNALNEALKIGYRHIDTATIYGNERIIGNVLKEWISSGKIKREDLFITTKLAFYDEFPEKVEEAITSSLRKLQLDYIDLWLIHFPVATEFDKNYLFGKPHHTDFISVWKKMEEQVDAGRTRTIGLSNFNISQIERVQQAARIQPANLQVEANLYFQQRELREFASKNNMTVVAYSPLGSPGLNTFLKELNISPVKLPDILNDPVVKRIANKHKKSCAQIALRFLLESGLAFLVKSTNPGRLAENFDIFDFTLDEDDLIALEALDKGKKAKIFTFLGSLGDRVTEHPEYPFHENLPNTP